MLSPSQIQFRMMTPDAQRAALQRLTLRGCDIKTISMQTGMPEADVKSHLNVFRKEQENRFVPVAGKPDLDRLMGRQPAQIHDRSRLVRLRSRSDTVRASAL